MVCQFEKIKSESATEKYRSKSGPQRNKIGWFWFLTK